MIFHQVGVNQRFLQELVLVNRNMAKKILLNDSNVLGNQYSKPQNLRSRLTFHDNSSARSWQKWLFSHIKMLEGVSILDVGCGLGELWSQNFSEIPSKCQIAMFDKSPELLKDASTKIGQDNRFNYISGDAHKLPFDDHQFDVVLANHMLYHVDVDIVLNEIKRVLKDGGKLYASTNGKRHMIEMHKLFGFTSNKYKLPFSVENGNRILRGYFSHTKRLLNEVHVSVSDEKSIVNYGLSMTIAQNFNSEQKKAFKERVKVELLKNGSIQFTKHSALFIAYG